MDLVSYLGGGVCQTILKNSMPLERGVATEKSSGLEGKEIAKGLPETMRNVLPFYMELLKNDQVTTPLDSHQVVAGGGRG